MLGLDGMSESQLCLSQNMRLGPVLPRAGHIPPRVVPVCHYTNDGNSGVFGPENRRDALSK